MMTVEDRLATVVSLLPAHEQQRFAVPFAKGESADSRLVEAVKTLARAEGLSCSTQDELAQARARVLAQVARLMLNHRQTARPEHDNATRTLAAISLCRSGLMRFFPRQSPAPCS